MKYFSKFPYILYNGRLVRNILPRVQIDKNLIDKSILYYTYDFKDSDKDWIIAEKLYNDPYRNWIVNITNNIFDPKFQYPLPYQELHEYIDDKYSEFANNQSGLEYAMTTVHPEFGYRKIITTIDIDSDTVITNTINVDESIYANTGDYQTTISLPNGSLTFYQESKEELSIYDYEIEQNELKRSIKILRPEYVSQIENQLEKLLK